MKHLITYNESIRDKMTPRSEDDILKSLENRNIQDHRKEILKETRRLYKVMDGKHSMSRAFCNSIGNYMESYIIEHGELTTDQMDDLYDMFLRGYNIVSYDGNKNGFEKMLITMKNNNWKLIIKDEYTDNDDNRIEYIFVKEPDKIASGKMISKSKKDDLYDMLNHLTQDELFDKLAQSIKGNDMTLARLVLPYIDLEDDDRELKLCRLCVDLGHIQILEMLLKKGLGMYVVKSLMYYVKNVKRSSREIVDMVEKYKNLPTLMR